ncbi:MAG: nicotinamide mononucleotide transporter [Methanosphaera stadtmanae]|nr:nicotinamide mononucleotide transporter [Methanosphaera stadtmanae]
MNPKKIIKQEIQGWKTWEKVWLIIAVFSVFILSLYSNNNMISIIAAITGIISVICSGKGKLSGFGFGVINAIVYAYIAYNTRYYGEMLLNLFYYLPLQFYGFYIWSQHINPQTKEVIKTSMNKQNRLIVLIIAIVTTIIYGVILSNFGDSYPFLDSFCSVLSVITMILAIKRFMEQWILWIGVNSSRILLWILASLNNINNIAILLMSIVYLINSIIMFIKWKNEIDLLD